MRKQGYFRKGAKNAEKNRIMWKRTNFLKRMLKIDDKFKWRLHRKLVNKYDNF